MLNIDAAGSSLPDQASGLLSVHRDRIANAANLAALLFLGMKDVNWVGFYFRQGDELVLGPVQGKPACVVIPMGRGVCGTAAATRQVQRVAQVHEFDGHIACDTNSVSEMVIPLLRHGEIIGVLDIDSPLPDRFQPEDQAVLEAVARIYLDSID